MTAVARAGLLRGISLGLGLLGTGLFGLALSATPIAACAAGVLYALDAAGSAWFAPAVSLVDLPLRLYAALLAVGVPAGMFGIALLRSGGPTERPA